MDGFTDSAQEEPGATTRTYACTFGTLISTEWTDQRSLTWPELAALLTHHEVGPKEGTCIVPATFTGKRRHKNDAARIDVVMLDSDAGYTLEQIRDAIADWGWAAVIASTHSHLTTRTKARWGNWGKFLLSAKDPRRAPAEFLLGKDYLPHVAEGARVAEETDEGVVLEHQPCPKFRIALPLLRPWLAASYDDQKQANVAWKERIEALAAALHLSHDQACTDTSRLFFLPRRPADGPPPETAVLEGDPCDLFGLPAAEPPETETKTRKGKGRRSKAQPGDEDGLGFADRETGEILDLREWARKYASRFEIVSALKARRPDVFNGRVAEGTKHHLRCVNEDAHTQAGEDAATFVVNASESTSRGFVHHCRHAHCDGRDRLLFLHQMLQEGWLKVVDLTDRQFLSGEERPTILYVQGELPSIVDQAETALIQASLGIYQRGAFIVRPGIVRVGVGRKHEGSALRILELGDRALVEAMTRAADWLKVDGRAKEPMAIDAPISVATTYLQRVGRWKLPVLTGLINAPTLRADGSILAQPGYDATTGLLFLPRGAVFPEIPDQPEWEDGRQALSVLMQLIETFPFVGEADRAVALSAILTACIRRSLPTAPLHAFSAPVMGSGKSKLVDLATLIANGQEAAVIAQGKTEEELEKRLGALLLGGEPVIPIDNCEAPLGGEFLCQMLTQPVVRARILGRSEAPELPANGMVTATGNNLVLIGDMARRAVLCQLDPKCERPELRTFASDPVQQVKADRPRYLAAALTVLRAYHVAGRPKQADPLGSFGDWSRWVRDALIWLGQSDPVETMETVRAQDPKLDALTAVLSQWSSVIGSARVSVQDIIERATRTQGGQSIGYSARPELVHPSFREALLQVAGDNGAINSRRLSRWISGNENRIVDGLKIVRRGVLTGFMTWELQRATEKTSAAA
ncbi:hypothetical protein [Roseomonas xinghualingensis]|uniref:hypothetical protein n=1 Tax=Roseomonas xinghualingensis TaxID=2986475 RepID=UPI0021F0E0C1|nr:hypothetical protein [Roseomonas sp. SXEYE001]MCV4210302.1 hypothetical protein [Roseomonas sp. SXEYE001]